MFQRGFLKEHGSVAVVLYAITDVAAIVLGALIAHWIKFDVIVPSPSYRSVVSIGVLLALLLFPQFHLYDSWRGRSLAEQARNITLAWIAALFALIAVGFVVKSSGRFSRLWIGEWALIAWFLLLAARSGAATLLWMLRRRGWNLRKVVLIGKRSNADAVIARVKQTPWGGLQLFCFVDMEVSLPHRRREFQDVSVRAGLHRIDKLLSKARVDEVWICLPLREQEQIDKVLHALRHSTVTIRLLPDISGVRLLSHPLSEVLGLPMVNLNTSPVEGVSRVAKAVEDRILSVLILTLISPLMLAIALCIKLSSPGPVFFRQKRVGWNGREFTILKFRSMPITAEARTGPVWACAGERRATRIGAFLRRTSLDELPQFLNVLRGDMSIVGPRPERRVFVDQFKDEIPNYMQKHMVKAGITGWAQINGWRGNTDLHRRIEHDLYYIENWSVGFDIKIIVLTLFRGFSHPNAY